MTQPHRRRAQPPRAADCVAGGTLITTATGLVPAARLARMRTPPALITYDHTAVRFTPNTLLAVRAVRVPHLREVITESGRSLWCTPDHPVYAIGRGYQPAHTLRAGNEILAATENPEPHHTRAFMLPWLQGKSPGELPTQPSVQAPPPAPPRPPAPTMPRRQRDWIRAVRAVKLSGPTVAYDFHVEHWPNYIADGVLVHTAFPRR